MVNSTRTPVPARRVRKPSVFAISAETVLYPYPDRNGREVFQVVRNPGKVFFQRHRVKSAICPEHKTPVYGGWCKRKPKAADALLFNNPYRAISRHQKIALTEGEKDCLHFAAATGIVTSSHHGGARHFTEAQARQFRGFRGEVLLFADDDPEYIDGKRNGGYGDGLDCCLRRWDLLLGTAHLANEQICAFLPPKGYKDVSAALSAGEPPAAFRPLSRPALVATAPGRTPRDAGRTGSRYGDDTATPEEIELLRELNTRDISDWPTTRQIMEQELIDSGYTAQQARDLVDAIRGTSR